MKKVTIAFLLLFFTACSPMGRLIKGREVSLLSLPKIMEKNNNGISEGKLYRGIGFLKHNDHEAAIFNLKEAVDLNEKNYLAHFYLALALKNKGIMQESIDEYEKSISIFPGDSQVYYNLAVAYYNIGEVSKAKETIDKAKEIEPSTSKVYEEVLKHINGKSIDVKFLEKVESVLQVEKVMSEVATFSQEIKPKEEQNRIKEELIKKYSDIQEKRRKKEKTLRTPGYNVAIKVGTWLSGTDIDFESRFPAQDKESESNGKKSKRVSKWGDLDSTQLLVNVEYIPRYWLSFDAFFTAGENKGGMWKETSFESQKTIGSDSDSDTQLYGGNIHFRSHKINNFIYDGFLGFQHFQSKMNMTNGTFLSPTEDSIPGLDSTYEYSFDSLRLGGRLIYQDETPSLTNFGFRAYMSILPWSSFSGEGIWNLNNEYVKTTHKATDFSGFDGEFAITYHPYKYLFFELGYKYLNLRVGSGDEKRTLYNGTTETNNYFDGFRVKAFGPFISAFTTF